MSHIVVTEEELLQVLNSRLRNYEECNGCRFTAILRVTGAEIGGCNWTTANLRCSGVPTSAYRLIADAVVAEVSQTHNLVC